MSDANQNANRHWVFRAHLVDRAGAVTSIASAFSNEGISIDTIVAHKSEEKASIDGGVVLTLFCSEEEKDIMVRKIKRLSKVKSLAEHPYESRGLRKSAVIQTTRKLLPADVAGQETFLTCEMINSGDQYVYFLAGSPSELDIVLEKLALAEVITEMVYSVIGL